MSDAIPTGCGPVDDLLGGGFERGAVSQVYGPPASGKTNVALSAAVSVAAAGGQALYIDTEGLSVDRFQQLARAQVRAERGDAGRDAFGDGEGGDDGDVEAAVDDLASRLIISEALDFEEQAEAVKDAEGVASQVDLVVLDSATGFYRLERDNDDEGAALRDVVRQVTHLLSLARRHDLAVVITNQVYSDPDSDRTRGLGGHTLAHWSAVVLRLERFRGGNRRATLEKHRSKPAGGTVRFRIADEGLVASEEP
nr:AAA family ATPase [Halomarina sp. BCD28]